MYAFRQVSDRCLEHHACAIYVKHLLCASAYTFAYTLATGCAFALMYVQFVHLVLGNKNGDVQLVYDPRRCKTSSVGQSAGLSIPRSSVRFRQKFQKKTEKPNLHVFELHRPSSKGTKLLFHVTKATINRQRLLLGAGGYL